MKKTKPNDPSLFPLDEYVRTSETLLFDSLNSTADGTIKKQQLLDALSQQGIQSDDPRFLEMMSALYALGDEERITREAFTEITRPNSLLLQKVLQGKLIIPDFQQFSADIRAIYERTRTIKDGKVADYIPQLQRVDPEQYGVAVCTVDGQRYSVGDSKTPFCVQSGSKPITYCLALEEHGSDRVHQHVGHEPSGKGFSELTLNNEGLPHNPMINAGAIMCCSLIKPELTIADRFDYVMQRWQDLCGGQRVGFNNAVYLSERQTADRNFALGYFMREKQAFPPNTDLIETLEFYFQCCSIEVSAEQMAIVASSLANGGVCPMTGKRVFDAGTVKNCLSLMYSCGMYDYSGEFAFTIGLPAKSGVSGVIMLVVPNVMGMCLWSPRLDALGNSVRGLAFCQELVKTYNLHNYDSLVQGQGTRRDPRLRKNEGNINGTMALCWAAAQGDLREVQHLLATGVDINEGDYDGRTPMHLAASEGRLDIVVYFATHGVDLNPKDRWGGTPLADAKRQGHQDVVDWLVSHGATL